MSTRAPLLVLALLGGCDPWRMYGLPYAYSDAPLWDPSNVVTADGGLYAPLASGEVAFVTPTGEPTRLDLSPLRVSSVQADGRAGVLARGVEVFCDDDEPVRTGLVQDCPDDSRRTEGRALLLTPDGAGRSFDVGRWFGTFVFSPDGRFAVAPIDTSAETSGAGLVSLDAVRVLDLTGAVAPTDADGAWDVSVGFAPRRVLFLEQDGSTAGLLVLSESEVAVVDLDGATATPRVVFPLSLDAADVVEPLDVVLTPDASHALLSVAGREDLYVLDLVNPSINVIGLRARPSDLLVDAVGDRTFVAYRGSAHLDVIDHDRFEVDTVDLASGADRLALADGAVVGWAPGGADVFRVGLADLDVVRYRTSEPVLSLEVSPRGDAVAAFTGGAGSGRLELLDLREVDGRVDDEVRPFALDTTGLDLAWSDDGDVQRVLVLQSQLPRLYTLTWPALAVDAVELDSPAVVIGTLDDGTFYLTHADALGLVSFLGADGAVTSQGGFARFGLLDRDRLAGGEEE